MTAITQTQNPKIYPGLNCSSVEFFNHDDELKAFANGKMVDYTDLPYTHHVTIENELKKLPEVNKILQEWFPNSKLQQQKKFCSCRFGGLDFTPDIKNFELQAGEYWECPLRGNCKGEGIVCKNLTYNNHELSHKEIKTMKLLCTNYTNEAIYEALEMCKGTYNVFKKQLYKKLGGIQTKQEVAVIATRLNLI